MTDLILASASPRRRELLAQIGVDFETLPLDIPEVVAPGEAAEDFVRRLALEKARAGFDASAGDCPALGSDTAVVVDGRILGKPANEAEAVAMLLSLSGRWHRVLTGVALVDGGRSDSRVVATEVEFARLSEAQCRRYWASGEPRDKAGAYGIQGLGAVFVTRIEGSYSAVVGLPLAETADLLEGFGVPIWNRIHND
ncbi:Maf-like protein [Marinobacterium nitratireducens]|uniref:dTTP/UTP pyrophosphatase n=1 Tax=Marinobacterium nitratireducens TaxID=518897 RepID=A0A917ZHX8_9GAMM|nr:nucleoside triphosphate pyrophosphatase [Marinobacterium nitratireducens]GGO82822.1 Maf-like protein [Marinobacterium nitratireducens]